MAPRNRGQKHKEKGNGSARSVKSRIRDIKRLLQQEDLPANVRVEKERILESLEDDFKDKRQAELEKKLTQKYRMVKFFERRKLTRVIVAAEKKIAAGECNNDEVKELNNSIAETKRKLNYVVYFPKLEPYVSICTTEPLSEKGLSTRTEIFNSINEAVNSGKLHQVTTDAPNKALFDPKSKKNNHSHTKTKLANKRNNDIVSEEANKPGTEDFEDMFFVLDKGGNQSHHDIDTIKDTAEVANPGKKRKILGGADGDTISYNNARKKTAIDQGKKLKL
eukprot:CFRG8574T1